MTRRDDSGSTSLLPVLVTAAVSVVGLAAVVAATAMGWLGPDVGRADQFCEVHHWHLFAQPANSLSNLGFTVAALVLAWHARRPSHRLTTLGLTTTFTATVALLAPASMAMHATNSAAGGIFDVLAMHLVGAFAAVYALSRLAPLGTVRTVAIYAVTVAVATRATARGGRIEILHHAGNLVFAILLVTAVVLEVMVWRRDRTPTPKWALGAVATLVVGFGIWLISQTGGLWCIPDSWLQGHALWHLLCALAVYLLGRHYMSVSSSRRR